TPGGRAAAKYPELQKYLAEHQINASDLPAVRSAVLAIRRRKGMVIDSADPDTRSDGSFFTNPIIPPHQFEDFEHRARAIVGEKIIIPRYPAENGVKLSAAWLMEHAGFTKGFTLGRAGLSSKHCLAIINRNHATAADVLELVKLIQDGVKKTFNITLQPEPNFIGF